MVTSNASLPSPSACQCNHTIAPESYYSNAAVVAISIPIAVFAIFTNGIVIVTVARTRSLHRPANILLSSLALSDLLVGATVQPAMIAILLSLNAGGSCCPSNVAPSRLVMEALLPFFGINPFVQICVMSWDRFKAVSSPMIYRAEVTNKKALVISVMSWLAWVALFVCIRIVPRSFTRVFLIAAGASVVTFIVVIQVCTIRAIRRRNAQIADINASVERNAFAKEKKMAVTLRWILALNLLSFCPQILYSISALINGEVTATHKLLFPWVRLMLCLNSSLGPIVYFWRHKNMRSAALQLLACAH